MVILWAIGGFLAAVLGQISHELTHQETAHQLGIDAEIDWLEWTTRFDAADCSTKEEILIKGSPYLAGGILISIYLLSDITLGRVPKSLLIVFVVCLLLPSRDDLRLITRERR